MKRDDDKSYSIGAGVVIPLILVWIGMHAIVTQHVAPLKPGNYPLYGRDAIRFGKSALSLAFLVHVWNFAFYKRHRVIWAILTVVGIAGFLASIIVR